MPLQEVILESGPDGIGGSRLSWRRGWFPKRRARRYAVPGRLFVSHAVAVAELHARLIEAERLGHWELLDLASEPACWRRFAAVTVKPDSYVRLARGDFEYSYFVELDRGTEGSRTIERQMERYLDYFQTGKEQAARGVFPKVLWLAPDADRAAVISDLVDRLAGPEHELFAVAVFGGVTDAVTAKAGSTEHVFRSTM